MRHISILMAVLAALAGCDPSPSQQADPVQKLTVALTTQPQGTLIHVAQAKGFFVEERLDIQPQVHTFGKAALQSLLDGQADVATAAETPIMFSILKGEKIFILAHIVTSTTNNAIVARRDAGIAKAADLKGKRVGFTPGTTSDFFVSSWLTANGMTRKDIQPIGLKPEDMRDAILSGKVDAVATWNYQLTQISNELATNGAIFFDKDIYTETFNLVAQQEFARKNPAVIKRFLRALGKAEKFTHEHPDEAQAIVSTAIQVDKDLVRSLWNHFDFRLALDQTVLLLLEDETRWAMKLKLTDRTDMPNYLSFIYFEGLKAVKPGAIWIKP